MKLVRFVNSSHQGLGLLVGIQVLLWISGGFVMSVLPIEKVRGEDWAEPTAPPAITTEAMLLAPDTIAHSLAPPGLHGAELATWLSRPVYRLHTTETVQLVDAVSGRLLSPVSADDATRVARESYTGPGTVRESELWDKPLIELRGVDLPVWRVDFDDSRHTTVYVSPQTGEVVSRRNRLWRIYDFFWMLHIMDYNHREDFNHPLLIIAAVLAWLLATSGIWLVVLSFRRSKRRRRAK